LSAAPLIEGFSFPTDRIVEVAKAYLDRARLADIEADLETASEETGLLGFPVRTQWLIIVSFVVCVVGIANAMLMSVTERFREIATMKCLGATDGFIMINFILESMIPGVAGGLIGTVLGFALGAIRSVSTYGSMSFTHLPMASVVEVAFFSFVISILVSALAAVYPARVAARLAPMEAMRIE
jgi:ABC-type lipoprotein release transport system permease subunit